MNTQDQLATQRVVISGKKLMYSEKGFPMLKSGMMSNTPISDKLATEAAGLVKMLQDRANGAIPRQVLLPAAAMLLLEIAKFMQDMGIASPTPEDIKTATQKLAQIMQQAFPNVTARTAGAPASAPPPTQPPAPTGGLINQAQGA